jgi:hypothetical protein
MTECGATSVVNSDECGPFFPGGTGVKAAGDSFRPGQAFQQLAAELERRVSF